MFKGFEPVFDSNSKILILGSFPSVKSRAEGFYYGNPQNRFWRTLEKIFGEAIGKSKEEKIAYLLKNMLALWDIIDCCNIKGSSDSSIKDATAVDLNEVLSYCNIEKIICNGKKSYEILKKNYLKIVEKYTCICLPSTSSANVLFDEKVWLNELGNYFEK